jgi:hypothetical protein
MDKELFLDDISIKGKHGQMARELSRSYIDANSKTCVFVSAVELYVSAALAGSYYSKQAIPDQSSNLDLTIQANQLTNHSKDLWFAFHTVMLNEKDEALSTQDKINNAFKYSPEDPEYLANYRRFEEYMLAGIEILHEALFSDKYLRFGDYLVATGNLIDQVATDNHKMEDKPVDFTKVF